MVQLVGTGGGGAAESGALDMAYPGHPGAGGGYYQGGYGAAPGGPVFHGQTQDPLYGYFAAVAGQDGQIDADELQRCLTQSGIAGGYKPFNLETCRLMISMLDFFDGIAKRHISDTKAMQVPDFKSLFQSMGTLKLFKEMSVIIVIMDKMMYFSLGSFSEMAEILQAFVLENFRPNG
ncbi:sorcin isoform X2 [Chelonoidis abingdonii]|uniref:sorcin isoform X2 n=1 Tax=Chelonoidis abingdonii TaxID=106734 RepID=UPI003F4988ED